MKNRVTRGESGSRAQGAKVRGYLITDDPVLTRRWKTRVERLVSDVII